MAISRSRSQCAGNCFKQSWWSRGNCMSASPLKINYYRIVSYQIAAHWIVSWRISMLRVIDMHALGTKEWKLQISFLVFFHFWAWDLIVCTRSQQQRIEPRKSNIQSQAIQFIPVRDIQNLQRQSSATFTPFSLLRKSRRSFVFAKVHVLILQPLHGFPIIKVMSASPQDMRLSDSARLFVVNQVASISD